MITKTNYIAYLQCPLRYWLDAYSPDLAAAPDPSARRRMESGMQVEQLARNRFPHGTTIPYRPEPEEMVALTREVLRQGDADVLFQATVTADDLLVKTDILERRGEGWHLIEVKSTTSLKESEHGPDLGFQQYVLERAGLPVEGASVMHLNRDCRYPDLDDLFLLAGATDLSRAHTEIVVDDLPIIRAVEQGAAPPEAGIGKHCSKPHPCPFYDHCWQDVDGLTVFDIPRLSPAKTAELRAMGALHLHEVPPEYHLTETQRAFVDFHNRQEVNIHHEDIRRMLDSLEYPLHFFDFETIDHAVPRFDGTRPYQQVPFQFSCHVLEKDGSLSHHEYLHTDQDDPRPKLVEALLETIGPRGQVVVYHAPFERGVLHALADAFPEEGERLRNVAGRLWDQLDIFRRHYRHHGFGKSNSLKSVLPVVVPGLSYEALDVQDGLQAQVAWEAMIACESKKEKEKLIEQMLAYCRLDTLAMVEMHRVITDAATRTS